MVKGSRKVSRKKSGGSRSESKNRSGRQPGDQVRPEWVRRALEKLPRKSGKAMEIAKALRIRSASDHRELEDILHTMRKSGELELKNKVWRLKESPPLIGALSRHPDGFGFVKVSDDKGKDLFVPPDEMDGLMHGDVIEVRAVTRRGRSAAKVVRVVEKAPDTIIGQFMIRGGAGFVEPRSKRLPPNILIAERDAKGATDGSWVRVKLQRGSSPLRGKVIGNVAGIDTPAGLIDMIIAEGNLPSDFPLSAIQEAESIPQRVAPGKFPTHKDFTHLCFVTIDGEDARDFDDAICILPRGNGFEAFVAIADVAEYVKPGSPLDTEALERSNSFYFPNRVIPMLPEALSNGLCSLNPDVLRLAMVVRMRFDAGGKCHATQLYEGIIRSRKRLTYTQVGHFLEGNDARAIDNKEVEAMLLVAANLYRKLDQLRQNRGALDLELPEVKAVIENDKVKGMEVRERNIAHKLIEEMMLAANTSVATWLEAEKKEFLYRVHEPPKPASIESVNDFLEPFGSRINMQGKRPPAPGDFEQVLEQSIGKPYAHVLHRLILRSMQQARYSPDNKGHFGLAYRSYCHFTSPIRRYADLSVHRSVKSLLRKQDDGQPKELLIRYGEQTSSQERKQARAEWDTEACLAALFHSKDTGETFKAVIGGMTQRRMFVELQPTLAEASFAVEDLGRSYVLDESSHRLVCRRSGHAYHLGDTISVMIDSTDPVRGLINVSLVEEKESSE